MKAFAREHLDAYVRLIMEYNRVHNISGAKTLQSVMANINDSIAPLEWMEDWGKTCIDIGSGAGFPALPLAISLPKTEFHLFEPIAKKSAFLHLVKTELKLDNVHVNTVRIEKHPHFKADTITSRAVTNTRSLIELVKPFATAKTTLLLYKGSRAKEETDGLENVRIITQKERRYVIIKDFL
jgi:16S rRNA (guanine527-N7)-methyltransferase